MLRRPKVQFKPKISTGSDSKPVTNHAPKPAQTTVEIIQDDAVCEVSNYVAIETSEVSLDNIVFTVGTEVPETHTIVIEPRETPVISIPSSQESFTDSYRKRTRSNKTTVEVVDDSRSPYKTPVKQSISLKRHLTPKQSTGQSSRKRPKICLSSSKQNLPLDRSKVTMFDLLSYNPPLSEEQKEKKKNEEGASDSDRDDTASSICEKSPFKVPLVSKSKTVPSTPKNSQESIGGESNDSSERGDNNTESSGPRVKIGADGNIVIDEESLIVKRIEPAINESSVINEGKVGLSSTNYESFRRKKTARSRWTEDETLKFYHALSAIGTDFSLMADTFFRNSRTREELRNKFKKEEKMKSHLIDSALAHTNLKYATDYLEKVNKKSSQSKSPESSAKVSPAKPNEKNPQTRKSPRNLT